MNSGRWSDKAVGNTSVWFDATVEPSSAGVFRVWSTKFDDPWLLQGRILLRTESYDLVRVIHMSVGRAAQRIGEAV